jgi:hypothetical protein
MRQSYSGMIAQMPEAHYAHGIHTTTPQATHTAAHPSSSEDWSDCELARVALESRRANRYTQEERATSQLPTYA